MLLFTTALIVMLLWGKSFSNDGMDIFEACEKGNLKVAAMLIGSSPKLVNAKTQNGHTPLMFAALNGDAELVKFLIGRGAELNAASEEGGTALGVAASQGYDEVVRFLIAEGADVNRRGGLLDLTPLYGAACEGRITTITLLIANGSQIDARDVNERTPLWWAASMGQKEAAEVLIAKGADVNIKDTEGSTALHVVTERGYAEIARLLIANGAQTDVKDKNGDTPLDIAVKTGNKEIASILQGSMVK